MGLQYNYGKLVMRIIEALPDHQLQLSPAEGSDNTPTTSTDSGVGAMHNQISDTCNAVSFVFYGKHHLSLLLVDVRMCTGRANLLPTSGRTEFFQVRRLPHFHFLSEEPQFRIDSDRTQAHPLMKPCDA